MIVTSARAAGLQHFRARLTEVTVLAALGVHVKEVESRLHSPKRRGLRAAWMLTIDRKPPRNDFTVEYVAAKLWCALSVEPEVGVKRNVPGGALGGL